MSNELTNTAAGRSGTWLTKWLPEDTAFWESEGKSRAWRTLWITTANLIMAFIAYGRQVLAPFA